MGKKILECHQGYDRDERNNQKKQSKAREDTEQSMKLVYILCEWPRMDLPINKGTGNIQGYNIATLFAKDIKTKLKEILELEEGDKRCYEPHWRHMRWIDRNDLTDHNVMNNSVKGMEERNKLFHKEWSLQSSRILP
ncbi:uncharacterized protein LOC133188918 [Saccostrea echinata]|uniref:uncharacterized protein LOC133188918 n=1 Tax=Saccostrea echinata TaxID=191078 RepID=UPI002A80F350|nr:uncharacterized protein LOC133188918 [Saccostrea echinata]